MLSDITTVFSEIGTWISSALTDMMPVFYTSGTGLTFLGVLAVASLGFSCILLVLGLIQKFMKFGA